MEKEIIFSDRALAQLQEAINWYRDILPSLANRFQKDFLGAISTLQKHPGVSSALEKIPGESYLKIFPTS